MTALVADRNTNMKDTDLLAVPVAAGVKLFSGALAAANATGYATPGAASTALVYLGRVEEFVDNTAGADGAKTALIRRNKAFKWANLAADAVTQARVGKRCFIANDQTVAATNGNGTRSPAGIVTAVDADGVWVAEMSGNSLSATALLTYAAIAAAASEDQPIAVPGAAVGDSVELGLPAAPAAGILFFAFVSAADVVTVRAMNITAAAVTPPAAVSYRATVHKA